MASSISFWRVLISVQNGECLKNMVSHTAVDRFDEFLVAVPQIFDRVKSVALWSAKKKKKKKRTIKGYGSAATLIGQ